MNNYKAGVKERKVKTAFIAASGFGTRMTPFTKAAPKEILPLGSTPIIQKIVDECLENGIEEIYISVRKNVNLIKEHFETIESYKSKNIYFQVPDDEIPYGNIQGLISLRNSLETKEHILILWGDDFVIGKESSIGNIISFYEANDCQGVINVQRKKKEDLKLFGNVQLKQSSNIIKKVISNQEKQAVLVSNLAIIGQMVFNSSVFEYFKNDWGQKEPSIEIVLETFLKEQTVLAHEVSGNWVTVGDKFNFLKAGIVNHINEGGSKKELIKYINEL